MAKIKFQATLAGTNTQSRFLSASIDGDAKIVFETDRQQVAQVLNLFTAGKRLLDVTIEYDEQQDPEGGR